MKKIKAFFTALLIFVVAVTSLHLYADRAIDRQPASFGTWLSPVKYANADVMKKNIDKHTILVMGSSELEHGLDTPYHPVNILKNSRYHLMLVGEGYYQSLFHATALAGMEGGIRNKKAVLILSPQWFRKPGVLAEAYASRFSETNYLSMLKNRNISDKAKSYISRRTRALLTGDPSTLKRIKAYDAHYLDKQPMANQASDALYKRFLREKTDVSITTKRTLADCLPRALRIGNQARFGIQTPEGEPTPSYFDTLRKEAIADGRHACSNNRFHINNTYYNLAIAAKQKKCRNEGTTTGYSESPEYDDLRCFLEVCKDSRITPMLVMVPVNGPWYDYIGFDKAKRKEYYDNIRRLADTYHARLADFSDKEYAPAFMDDTIHIGWRGWVDVSEAIYDYAKE